MFQCDHAYVSISLEYDRMKTFFLNNLKKLILGYEVILVIFVLSTLLSLLFTIKRVRNVDRLPQNPGFIGTCLQFCAILFILAPKIIFVSNALIFAPYIFPIGYTCELLIVIGYNWLIGGDTKGNMNTLVCQTYYLSFRQSVHHILVFYLGRSSRCLYTPFCIIIHKFMQYFFKKID